MPDVDAASHYSEVYDSIPRAALQNAAVSAAESARSGARRFPLIGPGPHPRPLPAPSGRGLRRDSALSLVAGMGRAASASSHPPYLLAGSPGSAAA